MATEKVVWQEHCFMEWAIQKVVADDGSVSYVPGYVVPHGDVKFYEMQDGGLPYALKKQLRRLRRMETLQKKNAAGVDGGSDAQR